MCSSWAQTNILKGIYPERPEPRMGWLDRTAASAAGVLAPWLRPRASRFQWIIEQANGRSQAMKDLSEAQIRETSHNLRLRLRSEGYREDLVAQAFALIREVAGRTIGMRPFDVQLLGG